MGKTKSSIRDKVFEAVQERHAAKTQDLPSVDERTRLRKEAGIGQIRAGEIMGVPHTTFGTWERGVHRVPDDKLAAYKEFLDACRDAVEADK
jgi:DNA-binding transcriptional regulator YiaG